MRRLLKHSFSVAGAAISVAAAVIAPAAHADLVNNGDFSAGGSSLVSPIPGWNTSALLPGALGGIWGVQCTPPSPCNFFDADTAPPTDSLSQQITTVAGTVYKVSFGLNTDATGTGEFSALFGTRVLTDLVNPGPTGGFQQLSFTAMATAGTTPLLFNFNSFGQTAVENVSVAAVPEPQTLALFGIGFLVLLSAGKRSRSPWPAGIRRKAAAASALLVCASVAHAGGPCPQGAPAPCTWYVQANGTTSPTGDGGSGSPFNTLSQVQAASNPGDTIMVLPAPTIMGPLDMGISLQPGQTLRGAGPPVVMPTPVPPLLYPLPEYPVITTLPTSVPTSSGASSLPWITNTSATGNTGTGDAVDLAANTTVENLVIGGPNNPVYRGGIYGINVPGNIRITGNDLSYFNSSGTVGFVVQPFYLEAYTPGMANHAAAGINAGWAAIMIDSSNVRTVATINDNYIHEGLCGDEIDIRNVNAPSTSSAAWIEALINGNYIYANQQCTKVGTIEGIGTQTEAGTTGTVLAVLTNNVQNSNGMVVTTTGPAVGNAGANSDSLFVNGAGAGNLTQRISNNLYLNGKGGASTNGMEYIFGDGGIGISSLSIVNSVFQGNPGDMLEMFNRGNAGGLQGQTANLILENVVVQKTTISGGLPGYAMPPGLSSTSTPKLASTPDNTGECLGIGSVGAGDVTVLQMINTSFTGCGNNGIEVTNNYATGDGPVGSSPQTIVLDIVNSRISGSMYYNLWLNNISPLTYLDVKVQNSDLSGSVSGVGVGFDSQFGYRISNAIIDLGGGPLGSTGNNCFYPDSRLHDLEATTTTTLTITAPPVQAPGPQYAPTIYADNGYWGGGAPTVGTGTTDVPGAQIFTTQPAPYASILAGNPLSFVPQCGPGPGIGPGPQQLGLS